MAIVSSMRLGLFFIVTRMFCRAVDRPYAVSDICCVVHTCFYSDFLLYSSYFVVGDHVSER